MARYRRSSSRRSYGRGRRSYSRGYGTGRRRVSRTRSRRRSGGSRAARVVIQVVGGQGGVAASPYALGMKAALPVRARY